MQSLDPGANDDNMRVSALLISAVTASLIDLAQAHAYVWVRCGAAALSPHVTIAVKPLTLCSRAFS